MDCAGVEGCLSGTSCRLVFEHEKRDYQEENDFHRWTEQRSGASQRNLPGGSTVSAARVIIGHNHQAETQNPHKRISILHVA